MSQNTVDFSIDPSGDALLDDLLTDQAQNVLTSNSGTSRPAYAVAGTVWVDTTTTPWVYKMFDGTDDITLGSLDLTANTFTPSAISIPASSVSNGKLANVSQNTFKGRKDAAGTGSPQDMTASEARTAMSVYSIADVDALITSVPQPSQTSVSTEQSVTSTSYVDVTSLVTSVASLQSVSSKVMLHLSMGVSMGGSDAAVSNFRIMRQINGGGYSDISGDLPLSMDHDQGDYAHMISYVFLDSPATTDDVDYKIQVKVDTGSTTLKVNVGNSKTNLIVEEKP